MKHFSAVFYLGLLNFLMEYTARKKYTTAEVGLVGDSKVMSRIASPARKKTYSIPLYGPLNIVDYAKFLSEQKEIFKKCYPVPCPYQVNLDDFASLRFLGRGGFGKVVLVKCLRDSKRHYAMKIMKKQFLVENNFVTFALNEKRILQSLNFPFCVRLELLSQDKYNLYYFLPFVTGGEMFKHLRRKRRFNEDLAKFYVAQVVLALEYLHYLDLVYRDLKPENILIDHMGFLKVTDFGFTKIVTGRTYTFCGTPDYIAPEIILGLGHCKAADYWSLGVFIYELVSGTTPFKTENDMNTFKKILAVEYEMPKNFSISLQHIIRNLITDDVTKRLGNLKRGAEDLKQHSWFEGTDWLHLVNRKVMPPYIPSEQIDPRSIKDLTNIRSVISRPTVSSERKSGDSYDEHKYEEIFKEF